MIVSNSLPGSLLRYVLFVQYRSVHFMASAFKQDVPSVSVFWLVYKEVGAHASDGAGLSGFCGGVQPFGPIELFLRFIIPCFV